MILKDQVCTEQQARRLKELGAIQESLFYWYTSPHDNGKDEYWETKEITYMPFFVNASTLEDESEGCTYYVNQTDQYSAFTVAELGLMLPDVDNHEFIWASFPDAGITEEGLDIDPPAFSVFIGPSVCHLEEEPFDNKIYPTEAQARAAFLIYCIENNKTTVAEVNHRLSPSSDK